MADSLHKTLRGLLADDITAMLIGADPQDPDYTLAGGIHEADTIDPEKELPFSKPCIIVAYGIDRPLGSGTNQRDDWEYPLFVGFFSVQGSRPTGDVPGLDPTLFHELIRDRYHNQRLAGADGYIFPGNVQTVGDVFDDTGPGFQDLKSGLVVSYVARRARGALT